MNVEKVIEAVKEAGEILENRQLAGNIYCKGTADYVTQVDKTVEIFLKEKLAVLAPEIGFLGEETGFLEEAAENFWILDPVDGTTNLIHDFQHSVISLGLCRKGQMVLGIIYDPYRDELYYAEKGKGSFLNGKPIHVSAEETMASTIIGFGTAPYHRELLADNLIRLERIYKKCQDIRRTGAAAFEFAYIACGREDGYFEVILQPWDFAAGVVLIEEAGGKITDFDGNPLNPRKGGSVVASNGKIHEELLALCRIN